ncbi:MAG: hypothetical protein H6Q15_1768 [Bacteroidetes bacterium]|nr:hypothetical protein [Bacteroidota bacterium]
MKGILLSNDFDLIIENRQIQIGENKEQCAELIIGSEKGEIKEYPQLGVGLSKYIKSSGRENEMIREVKLQLSLDNIDSKIDYKNGLINIDI